jgi:hypothetical protein
MILVSLGCAGQGGHQAVPLAEDPGPQGAVIRSQNIGVQGTVA